MAKYTTQIRSIVESGHPIFDFDYPIFDEKYRNVLETKIINRYYFREIGLETVGQFKHFLKTKLNEIMPYYNEQYLALEVFKTYDPYVNKDMTTTETRTNNQELTNTTESTGTSTAKSKGTTKGKTIFSDTPQAKLQDLDYATNLTDVDDESINDTEGSSDESATSTGNVKTTDEYVQTIKGFDGMKYASDVYKDVREVITNIDTMILDELNDLFMNIY